MLKRKCWLRIFGLVLLLFILWKADGLEMVAVLSETNLALVASAVLFNVPQISIKAFRWHCLLRTQGIDYSVLEAILSYFGGIFIGLLTPGRLGEFCRATHLNQDCGVSAGQAVSSVLADRLFDLYALLLVGGIAFFSLAGGLGGAGMVGLILLALLAFFALVLFVTEQVFVRIRSWFGHVGFLERLFASGSWLSELRAGFQQLSLSCLVLALGLTVLAYAVFFCQCYLLAQSLDLSAGFLSVIYAVALGSLMTLLPISVSGLGTREAAIVAYLGTVGVTEERALSFSLLVFVTFYVAGGLMGAVAWWIKPVDIKYLLQRGDTISDSGDQV